MTENIKTAIVTTYRGASSFLDTFVAYHLALGFDLIFLFADDPGESPGQAVLTDPRVIVVPHDTELRRRWQNTSLWRERTLWAQTYVDREVMMRQILNVAVAVEMAIERRVDWLLHLDADELFHCRRTTVAEHFRRLSRRGFAGMRYLNYEAAPERPDIVDCFCEVTLFKRNRQLLPRALSEYREVLESIPSCAGGFFHFYKNGKSAARVTADLRPNGVHEFAAGPCDIMTNPAILHYPCCTFEMFWAKYRTLGDFADKWGGTVDIRAAIGSTHLDSRDTVRHEDRDLAAAFYAERFVLRKQDTARLIGHGLATRVHAPSRLLAALGVVSGRKLSALP